MTRKAERRPAVIGAAQKSFGGSISIVPAQSSEPVDAAGVVDGVFVLVVRLDGDRYRRRVFLTLAPAERAAARAEARGHAAEVVLCRLEPVR